MGHFINQMTLGDYVGIIIVIGLIALFCKGMNTQPRGCGGNGNGNSSSGSNSTTTTNNNDNTPTQ